MTDTSPHTQLDQPAPVRFERDGDVAILVLTHPPQNLFEKRAFSGLERHLGALAGLTAPADASPARAMLVEQRGKLVSAGVQVTAFRGIAESTRASAGGLLISRPLPEPPWIGVTDA